MVLDQHQISDVVVHVQTARRIGENHNLHAQRLHQDNRNGSLLRRVALVEVVSLPQYDAWNVSNRAVVNRERIIPISHYPSLVSHITHDSNGR